MIPRHPSMPSPCSSQDRRLHLLLASELNNLSRHPLQPLPTSQDNWLKVLLTSDLNDLPRHPMPSLPVSSQERQLDLLLASDLNDLSRHPLPPPPTLQDNRLKVLLTSDLNDFPRRSMPSLPVSLQDRQLDLLLASDLNNLPHRPPSRSVSSQNRQLNLLLASDLNHLPRRPPSSTSQDRQLQKTTPPSPSASTSMTSRPQGLRTLVSFFEMLKMSQQELGNPSPNPMQSLESGQNSRREPSWKDVIDLGKDEQAALCGSLTLSACNPGLSNNLQLLTLH